MFRKETNPNVDQQIFRRTAAVGKAINIGMRHYRGGTRL